MSDRVRDEESEEDTYDDTSPSRWGAQTDQEAEDADPLGRLRAFTKAIRASGQRRDAFKRNVAHGIAEQLFVLPPGAENWELLRDVPTRWDSTYKMLDRARALRPVRFI